jgi:polyphosphate kinase
MPGLSENIRVRSLVGRFLEHARICYFENAGGEPVVLAGSGDWMPRNFYRRIEVLYPVADPALKGRIVEEILPAELRDNVNARELHGNGAYLEAPRRPGERPFSAQDHFIAEARKRAADGPA